MSSTTNIESLSRRILGGFLGIAAVMLLVIAFAYLSIASLRKDRARLIDVEADTLAAVQRVESLHQQRASELRAYLLTRDRPMLRQMRDRHASFIAQLEEIAKNAPPLLRERVLNVRALDSEYESVLEQALKHRARLDAILENDVRPRRERLEAALTSLVDYSRRRLVEARAAADQRGRDLLRAASVLAGFIVFLLAITGIGVWCVLRSERRAAAKLRADRDVSQTARQRSALLAETGRILSESSDPKGALGQVANLATEWLSQLFMIELTDGHDSPQPVALAISRAFDRGPLLASLHERLPQGLGSLFNTELILHASKPLLQVEVNDPRLVGLGVCSYIGVPLRARGRSLGVFLLARMAGAPLFSDADVQFARELSHQSALAIDNARLLQEAEAGLRMREELLATVAHDLKTPLSVVRMTAELGSKEIAQDAPAHARFRTVQDAVQEMQRLIQDLLELTQIEAGRIVLDKKAHDSCDLIDACCRVLAPHAAAKSIEVVRDVRPGECIADCDRNRVLQILANLAGNAIKFTASGGRIRVDAQATGEGIRFSVIDNGPGIPAEQLPYVFEKYWRSRPSGKQRGTGLGLSIARGLVEAHGGRIWAESAVNIGSRFFFTLPEARVTARPPARATSKEGTSDGQAHSDY